jgi:hypothetical protein
MNQIKPTPVSKEVAARYPINIFLSYTKTGVRQHTLESFPPGCTPAMLATMMQTGMHTLAHVSPYGVRLLVSSPIISVCSLFHQLTLWRLSVRAMPEPWGMSVYADMSTARNFLVRLVAVSGVSACVYVTSCLKRGVCAGE